MKTIIKWVAGVFQIISSFALIQFSFLAFIFWFLAGLLCLPPIFTIIEKKLSVKIVSVVKYCMVIGLFVLGFGIYMDTDEFKKSEKETAIKEEKERKEQAIKEANEDAKKDSLKNAYENTEEYKRKTEVEYANERPVYFLDMDYKGWNIEGFGTVGIHNFNIINKAKYSDFKDIVVKFTYYAESGTELDTRTETVYKVVKANSKIKVRGFNAGFIPSQAKTCRVEILSATSL